MKKNVNKYFEFYVLILNKAFKKNFILFSSLLIIFTGIAIYYNSLDNQFTNWDDDKLIVNNSSISNFNIKQIFVPHQGSTFQPIRNLSYALDYYFWELNPIGYHIQSILLHIFASIFLFLGLLRAVPLIQKAVMVDNVSNSHKLVALITSLIFLVHPINTEAVTWLSGRKYTLLAFFSFLGFYLFVKCFKENKKKYCLGALITTFFAVLSSPFGAVLPLLFLLFYYCSNKEINPIKLLKKEPFYCVLFLVSFILYAITLIYLLILGDAGVDKSYISHNPFMTLWSMIYSCFYYIRNLITPFWLNIRYMNVVVSWHNPIVIMMMINLIIVLIILLKLVSIGDKLYLFCFFWCFIAWLPSSNIIPISITMADRYIYIAGPGFFLAFVILGNSLMNYLRFRLIAKALIFLCIIIYLSYFTIQRNSIWQNSFTVWGDSLEKDPLNYGAHNNLGNAFVESGDFDMAIYHFKKALYLKPDFFPANYNFIKALIKKERWQDVVLNINNLLSQNIVPNNYKAILYNYLGIAFNNLGDIKNALYNYKKAIESDCLYLEPKYNICNLLINQGKSLVDNNSYQKAIQKFKQVFEFLPNNAVANYNIASVFVSLQRFEEAVSYYKQVLNVDPNDFEARHKLALVLSKIGLYDEVITQYDYIVKEMPNNYKAFYNKGVALAKLGRFDDAKLCLYESLKINPGYNQAINALTKIQAYKE